MIISERIFYVMEQKNITQLELSRRTGIATSNISDWKKKKTNPKADCLISICDALEITADQLLTGKGYEGFEEVRTNGEYSGKIVNHNL